MYYNKYIMESKFQERFKELKKDRGLSNVKLAEKRGVSHTTICRWENGKCDIKSNELVKVAMFFGVSAGYLVGLED